MTWEWTEQRPHANGPRDQKLLHILVNTDPTSGEQTYLAYVQEDMEDYGTPQFRSMTPSVRVPARGRTAPPPYHYTHDTLQEAKEWCVVELVKQRLSL